jgi:hypothetical protein
MNPLNARTSRDGLQATSEHYLEENENYFSTFIEHNYQLKTAPRALKRKLPIGER